MPKSKPIQPPGNGQASQNSRQPSLGDIAKRSGVSISAVSRILAEKKLHTFSPATIEKVRSLAEELRYRPNRLIQGIQTGKSGLVGVVGFPCKEFYGDILAGIHDELVSEGRLPMVVWSNQDSPRAKGRSELEQIHALVDLRVEGIILRPVFYEASDIYFKEILSRRIPLVVVDRALPRASCCYVGSDDEAGILAAMDHLRELKHTHICFFGADTVVSTGLHRLQTFRFYVSQDRNVKAVEHLLPHWEPTIEDGLACLEKIPRHSAILAVNDTFAWAIYKAVAQKGMRIPEDYSVVGYGNLELSQHLVPALTTVEQHPYEMGTSAARRLLLRISNPDEHFRKILLPPELLTRQSTTRARK